jgi:hypothetical protein
MSGVDCRVLAENRMPDADRFERLLRGKGWRRAYRLASGNAPISLVVDALTTASAQGLREQVQCPSLSRILAELCHSLGIQSDQNGANALDQEDAFVGMVAALDEIELDDFGYLGTRLARKSAERVFVELSRREDAPAFDEVRDRFADVFIADIVDNQCLSRIRPGVAEQTNRTTEEQFKWEQELREKLKPQARKLFQSAVKARESRAIRAPKRIGDPPTPLEVRLHEPLVPLSR